MRECCEQLVYKKYSTCKAMSLEKADSSDTKNNNAAIDNEGNVAITNEQRSFKVLDAPILLIRDEGKPVIARET